MRDEYWQVPVEPLLVTRLERQVRRKTRALIREMRLLPHFSEWQRIIAIEQERLYESGMAPEDALAVAYMNLILLLTP